MKDFPVKGTEEKTTGWFFDVWHDWIYLLQKCNWYDFTLIQVTAEYAPYTQRCELHLALLGFHFMATYVYDDKFSKEMKARMDEVFKDENND